MSSNHYAAVYNLSNVTTTSYVPSYTSESISMEIVSPTSSAQRTLFSNSSRRESIASRATTVSEEAGQPGPQYRLPCEFLYIGCEIEFAPGEVEQWISHHRSHFGRFDPPPLVGCIFCDDRVFENHSDRVSNWRERMQHIERHFRRGWTQNQIRLDFKVIDHLYDCRLISKKDYDFATEYTERPGGCPVEKASRSRAVCTPEPMESVDQSREDRHRKRNKEKHRKHRHHT